MPQQTTRADRFPDATIVAAKRALRGRIARTRWAMVAERAAQAFWPLLSLALVLYALYAFGLAHALPRVWLLTGLALAVGGLLASLLWGVKRFALPSLAEARARLDAALPGTPLQTLEDEIAVGRDDPLSQGLWARHLTRMAEEAANAKASKPDLRLAHRDKWAVRLVALVAALAALVFAGGTPREELALAPVTEPGL
ncbi:MAG: DUF4175 family protein, partial [Pseudomonadota bacterium]